MNQHCMLYLYIKEVTRYVFRDLTSENSLCALIYEAVAGSDEFATNVSDSKSGLLS